MTGLALTIAGWAGFGLVAALALRGWHAGLERGEAVARACHEVRNPLAAARLGLESGLLASSAPHLRAIEMELARATAALDDLQRVERISADDWEAEPVDVGEWLSNSVEAWRPVAAACAMEIRLDWDGPDAVVWGRPARLAQVTGNLIANGIDHGDVFVEVRGRVQARTVVIEVRDGGRGLTAPPDALLPRTGAGAGWPGTGWGKRGRGGRGRCLGNGRGRGVRNGRGRGLWIARATAEAHDGSLTTAPSTRGARFVLTLPLA